HRRRSARTDSKSEHRVEPLDQWPGHLLDQDRHAVRAEPRAYFPRDRNQGAQRCGRRHSFHEGPCEVTKSPAELSALATSGRLLACVFSFLDRATLTGLSTMQVN